MFRPKSCQATPIIIDVKPTMAQDWISMPPVIITKVTKMEMYQMGRSLLAEVKIRARDKNLGLAAPNTAHSAASRHTRNRFQLVLGPFNRRFISAPPSR